MPTPSTPASTPCLRASRSCPACCAACCRRARPRKPCPWPSATHKPLTLPGPWSGCCSPHWKSTTSRWPGPAGVLCACTTWAAPEDRGCCYEVQWLSLSKLHSSWLSFLCPYTPVPGAVSGQLVEFLRSCTRCLQWTAVQSRVCAFEWHFVSHAVTTADTPRAICFYFFRVLD